MKKNLILSSLLLFILAFSSCSKSEVELVIDNNVLVNTVWKVPYYAMSGPMIGYEVLEFPSNKDVIRTWIDLNGVVREYTWMGLYKLDGKKIICSVNNKTIELEISSNNTICLVSEGKCFVKQ